MRNSIRVIMIGMFVFISAYLAPASHAVMPAQQGQDCGEGSLLFFQQQSGIDEIWRLNIAVGSTPAKYVLISDSISATTPAWSGATQQLAFTGTNRSGYQDIHVAQADQENTAQILVTSTTLFPEESRERQPAWSVDGTMIAFAADSGGTSFDIWIINADGTGLQRLTNTPEINEFSPTWSPDGTRIAYVSDENTIDQIQILDRQQLTNELLWQNILYDNFSPVWSPQGEWIAFTQRESSGSRVYLVNLDERQPKRLTLTSNEIWVREAWPTWSIDGRYVAFAATTLDGSQPSSFDLYTVKVFDEASNLLAPVALPEICKISTDALNTSDEFGPSWTQ